LSSELRDNVDARELQGGTALTFRRSAGREESFSAQKYFSLGVARAARGRRSGTAPSGACAPAAT